MIAQAARAGDDSRTVALRENLPFGVSGRTWCGVAGLPFDAGYGGALRIAAFVRVINSISR